MSSKSKYLKNIVSKPLLLLGLKISRVPRGVSSYRWLRNLNINTVIDIGAGKGNAALEFHRIFPHAHIYSFEPLRDCFEQMNKKLKSIRNFRSFNLALSDQSGEETIYRSSYSGSSSLRPMSQYHKDIFPITAGQSQQTIKVETLDDIMSDLELKKSILIKMDVQGLEDKVIKGGEKTIKEAEVVIAETSFKEFYQDQPLFADIHNFLSNLGFVYSGSWAPELRSPLDGSLLQQDSIFIKEKL